MLKSLLLLTLFFKPIYSELAIVFSLLIILLISLSVFISILVKFFETVKKWKM